jgi:hypothetical protein
MALPPYCGKSEDFLANGYLVFLFFCRARGDNFITRNLKITVGWEMSDSNAGLLMAAWSKPQLIPQLKPQSPYELPQPL